MKTRANITSFILYFSAPKPDCSNIEHDGFFACGDVWSSESYGIMTAACR